MALGTVEEACPSGQRPYQTILDEALAPGAKVSVQLVDASGDALSGDASGEVGGYAASSGPNALFYQIGLVEPQRVGGGGG